MYTVLTELESISPYSQSRPYQSHKLDKESADDYEKRTWRERLHVDAKGQVFIPASSLKNCLSEAAKYLSVRIPGKGQATYTKHIEAGILAVEGILLDDQKETVEGEWLYLNADGKRGGNKRVWRCYPVIRDWKGVATWQILDETVTPEVFREHLTEAGRFIGIGRFRPRNNGFYGRFRVNGLEVIRND